MFIKTSSSLITCIRINTCDVMWRIQFLETMTLIYEMKLNMIHFITIELLKLNLLVSVKKIRIKKRRKGKLLYDACVRYYFDFLLKSKDVLYLYIDNQR